MKVKDKIKDISKLFKELQKTYLGFIIFEVIFSVVIVFLFFYFVLMLFNVPAIYAFIPCALYFIIRIIIRKKKYSVKLVEDKYPILREELRTAADTVQQESFIVGRLRLDVMQKIKNVKTSSFLNLNSLLLKTVAIIGLTFIILIAASYDIMLVDTQKFINNANIKAINLDSINIFKNINKPQDNFGIPSSSGEIISTDDIYGRSSVATLGEKELQLRIQLESEQIDVRDIKEVEQKQFKEIAPGEIFPTFDKSFNEKIPKEKQDLVRNYFNKLSTQE